MNHTPGYSSALSIVSSPSRSTPRYTSSWAGAPLATTPPRGIPMSSGLAATSSPIGVSSYVPLTTSPKTDGNQCKYLSPQRPAKGGSPIRDIAKVDDRRSLQPSPRPEATVLRVMQLETALSTLERSYEELKADNDKLLLKNADNIIADPPEKVASLQEELRASEDVRVQQQHNLEEAQKIITMLKDEMRSAASRERDMRAEGERPQPSGASEALSEALHQRDQAEEAAEAMLQEVQGMEQCIEGLKRDCEEHEKVREEVVQLQRENARLGAEGGAGGSEEKLRALEEELRLVTVQRDQAEEAAEAILAEQQDETQKRLECERALNDAIDQRDQAEKAAESLMEDVQHTEDARDQAERAAENLLNEMRND